MEWKYCNKDSPLSLTFLIDSICVVCVLAVLFAGVSLLYRSIQSKQSLAQTSPNGPNSPDSTKLRETHWLINITILVFILSSISAGLYTCMFTYCPDWYYLPIDSNPHSSQTILREILQNILNVGYNGKLTTSL